MFFLCRLGKQTIFQVHIQKRFYITLFVGKCNLRIYHSSWHNEIGLTTTSLCKICYVLARKFAYHLWGVYPSPSVLDTIVPSLGIKFSSKYVTYYYCTCSNIVEGVVGADNFLNFVVSITLSQLEAYVSKCSSWYIS